MEYVNLDTVIKKHSNPDKDTSMSPYMCSCQGERYIVKFVENIQGSRGLINEYVAYELGLLIGLRIPDCAFVRIPDNSGIVIDTHKEIRNIESRLAFGSKYIDGVVPIFSEEYFKRCSNKEELITMLLFDHYIDNRDRNENFSNTLFHQESKQVYAIDHERIFGAGNIWNKYSCNRGANEPFTIESFEGDTLYGMINRCINIKSYIEPAAIRIKLINEDRITEIIENIPSEWDCNLEDRIALKYYLVQRLLRIDELVEQLKRLL